MSCALCLEDCPTFKTIGRVTATPKGRIRLLKSLSAEDLKLDDELPFSKVTAREELLSCLGCLACESSCPADIKYGEILSGANQILFQEDAEYRSDFQRFLSDMPVHQIEKIQALTRNLYWLQRTGLLWLAQKTFLNSFLSKRTRTMLRLLCKKIPAKASSQLLPETTPPKGERSMRVGIMLGCMTDSMFAGTNMATVKVLQELGVEVITPQGQACCGAIHQHIGDVEEAKLLASKNCHVFSGLDLDAIVTNSAGCGSWTKEYRHKLSDLPDVQPIADLFTDVHELIDSLIKNARKEKIWQWTKPSIRVTYHDACHLIHAQEITRQPRGILARIEGIDVVELEASDECCGSAGIYNVLYPKTSKSILDRKIRNILKTKAQYVVMGNPGCLLQIQAGLIEAGRPDVKCLHSVDLLSMCEKL